MNVTDDILCSTCQTSNGFSSGDRRAIIVMVVLVGIAVVSCYVGVLWYGIRTRFRSNKDTNAIIEDTVHKNEAFNNEEEQYEEYVQPIDDRRTTMTP